MKTCCRGLIPCDLKVQARAKPMLLFEYNGMHGCSLNVPKLLRIQHLSEAQHAILSLRPNLLESPALLQFSPLVRQNNWCAWHLIALV
jgi:hypothetical protein